MKEKEEEEEAPEPFWFEFCEKGSKLIRRNMDLGAYCNYIL